MTASKKSLARNGRKSQAHKRAVARVAVLLISVLLPLLAGCDDDGAVQDTPGPAATTDDRADQHTFRPPVATDDGLGVGSPDEVGMDAAVLAEAVDAISGGRYGEIHSLLIYKEDRLVFEEYFPGHDYQWDDPSFHGAWVRWGRDDEHNVHSVGKSITSACVGVAVDRGFIDSVDQSIFDYLPEHQRFNTAGKGQITIEHLLTMTSGLQWDEWGSSYSDSSNDVIALFFDCDDPIACILEKPLVSEPGNKFIYSGGNTILLGEIVKNATGMDIEAFSWQYLFGPLGIETPGWKWIDDRVVFAAADQRLTPREMLKLGVTYLDHGVWDGQQILSEDWVARSATPYSGPDNTWFNHALRPIPPGDGMRGPRGYSYTWWTHEFSHSGEKIPAYWAFGWGGQRIIVLPNQDAVVVLTGASYTAADATLKVLTKYVIPAF